MNPPQSDSPHPNPGYKYPREPSPQPQQGSPVQNYPNNPNYPATYSQGSPQSFHPNHYPGRRGAPAPRSQSYGNISPPQPRGPPYSYPAPNQNPNRGGFRINQAPIAQPQIQGSPPMPSQYVGGSPQQSYPSQIPQERIPIYGQNQIPQERSQQQGFYPGQGSPQQNHFGQPNQQIGGSYSPGMPNSQGSPQYPVSLHNSQGIPQYHSGLHNSQGSPQYGQSPSGQPMGLQNSQERVPLYGQSSPQQGSPQVPRTFSAPQAGRFPQPVLPNFRGGIRAPASPQPNRNLMSLPQAAPAYPQMNYQQQHPQGYAQPKPQMSYHGAFPQMNYHNTGQRYNEYNNLPTHGKINMPYDYNNTESEYEDDGEAEYEEGDDVTFECGYYDDDGTFVEYECDADGYWDAENEYHLFSTVDNLVMYDADESQDLEAIRKSSSESGDRYQFRKDSDSSGEPYINPAALAALLPNRKDSSESGDPFQFRKDSSESIGDGGAPYRPFAPLRKDSEESGDRFNFPDRKSSGDHCMEHEYLRNLLTCTAQPSSNSISPISTYDGPVPRHPTSPRIGGVSSTPSTPRKGSDSESQHTTKPTIFVLIFPDNLVKNIPYKPDTLVLKTMKTQCEKHLFNFDTFVVYNVDGKLLEVTETTTMTQIPERTIYLCLKGQPWVQRPVTLIGDTSKNSGSSKIKFAGRTSEQEEKLRFEREREERMIEDVIKRDWNINIWEAQGELNLGHTENGEEFIESGSLNGIIQYLTFGGAVSVVNFICQWLELAATDWDPDLVQSLEELIKELTTRGSPLAKKVSKAVETMTAGKDSLKVQQARINTDNAPPVKVPKVMPTDAVGLILQVPALEIARQISLLDWTCFSRIKSVEFLDVAWQSNKLKYRAENVLQMINIFNLRSNWTSRIILLQKSFKIRVRCYGALLEIAKELYQLRSFSSCLAIMSGLSNSACYRLKHTRAALKKELIAIESDLGGLLDPALSHKRYRETLNSIVPPAIPHLGVFLGDLVFIEEGNPNVLHTNLINFRKRQFTYGVIRLIQGYQLQGYALRPVPTIQHILINTMKTQLEDKQLFNMSLNVEPRDFVPPK